jgi:hypothetical protein
MTYRVPDHSRERQIQTMTREKDASAHGSGGYPHLIRCKYLAFASSENNKT